MNAFLAAIELTLTQDAGFCAARNFFDTRSLQAMTSLAP
jgi:hypothetical protein